MRSTFQVRLGAVLAALLTLSAPMTVAATAEIGGSEPMRAFSPDSYWNTPLPKDAPRHPESDAMIQYIKADNIRNGCPHLNGAEDNIWGMPIFWASSQDASYNVTGEVYFLPAEFSNLRIPANARPMANSDAEMVIFDVERGYVSELWRAKYDDITDTWSASGGSTFYLDSNGLERRVEGGDPRNSGSYRGRNGAVAAYRLDEVRAGMVNHVIKVGLNTTNAAHQFPMRGSDGKTTDPLAPIQGARLRIRPDVDLATYELHPQALAIAESLQVYGMMVGDNTGAPVSIKLEDTVAQGRGQLWDVPRRALCVIPIELYEVIDYGYMPPPVTSAPPDAEPEPSVGSEPEPEPDPEPKPRKGRGKPAR